MSDIAYLRWPGPLALAHRGFTGQGSPENTEASFAAAIDLGFTYLETDVQATSDGVLVAFHDDTLHRLTGRPERIADLTWDELSTIKVGGLEPIPQFAHLLNLWPFARWNIDVKTVDAIDPLVQLLNDQKAYDRVLVSSFSDRRRLAVQNRVHRHVAGSAGRVSIGVAATAFTLPLDAPVHHMLTGVSCLQVPSKLKVGALTFPLVTSHFVRKASRVGWGVHVWTINDEDQMEALLDLGVSGLITDRADMLRNMLQKRGQWYNHQG